MNYLRYFNDAIKENDVIEIAPGQAIPCPPMGRCLVKLNTKGYALIENLDYLNIVFLDAMGKVTQKVRYLNGSHDIVFGHVSSVAEGENFVVTWRSPVDFKHNICLIFIKVNGGLEFGRWATPDIGLEPIARMRSGAVATDFIINQDPYDETTVTVTVTAGRLTF